MKKKILAWVLALALVVSVVPTSFGIANAATKQDKLKDTVTQYLKEYAALCDNEDEVYEASVDAFIKWAENPTFVTMAPASPKYDEPELSTLYVIYHILGDPNALTNVCIALQEELSDLPSPYSTEYRSALLNLYNKDISRLYIECNNENVKSLEKFNDSFYGLVGLKNDTNRLAFRNSIASAFSQMPVSSLDDDSVFNIILKAMAEQCFTSNSPSKWTNDRIAAENLQLKAVMTADGVQLSWNGANDTRSYVTYAEDEEGKMVVLDVTENNAYLAKSVAAKYGVKALVEIEGTVYEGPVFTAAPELQTTAITKLKKGKKKFTVQWNAVPCAQQYVISYTMVKKNKKKQVEKFKYVSAASTKATVKKLKKNKKYIVKVKPVYAVGSVEAVSYWSAAKKVKTK